MQLTFLLPRIVVLIAVASAAHLCRANSVPGPDMDWTATTYAQFSEALNAFGEEREPKNLPAIRTAIIELKERFARDQSAPQAMSLAVSFLRSQARDEVLEQKDAGLLPKNAEELPLIEQRPAFVEAWKIMREALARYPDSTPVLREALDFDLRFVGDAQRFELLRRLIDHDPDAFIERWELALHLVSRERLPEARREMALLLQNPRVDVETVSAMLDGLQQVFQGKGNQCDKLHNELQALLRDVPAELPVSRKDGSLTSVRYDFIGESGPIAMHESERTAKMRALKQVLNRIGGALSQSECGNASPIASDLPEPR